MNDAPAAARKLKCRFCSYATVPFYKDQHGKTKSGFRRLQRHIELHHEDEHAAMMAKIEADCRPEGRDAPGDYDRD